MHANGRLHTSGQPGAAVTKAGAPWGNITSVADETVRLRHLHVASM